MLDPDSAIVESHPLLDPEEEETLTAPNRLASEKNPTAMAPALDDCPGRLPCSAGCHTITEVRLFRQLRMEFILLSS